MAKPTMTITLDMPAGAGAKGYVRLVSSDDEDRTVVANATASDVAIAGDTVSKVGRQRTETVTTVNGSAAITAPAGTFDRVHDLGRPITGAGIPSGTTLIAVASDQAATLSANATAAATITATVDTDGLLVFPAMNPNRAETGETASVDVIDDPTGTCWELVVKYPNAATPDPVYFRVPDLAGPYVIGGALLLGSRPGGLAPPGAVNTTLTGDVIDTAGDNRLRDLLKSILRGQSDNLSRWFALYPFATDYQCDAIIVSDSTTRHMWSWASEGGVIEWPQQLARMIRNEGVPATADVRLAYELAINSQPVWYTTTGTVSATGNGKGLGCAGTTLSSGATWATTFGGTTEATWDPIPGDGADVYITKRASGGGSVRVLLDDVEVLAATSTNDATPSAILGHHLVYSTGKLDGEEHTIKVEAVGGPVDLDLVLVHHGTVTDADDVVGCILWNGALNGSAPQTHMDGGGFQDALRNLDPALVVVGNGATTYISDQTGALYEEGLTEINDYIVANSDADVAIAAEPEFAGFDLTGSGNLATGTVWAGFADVMHPIAEAFCETNGRAFVRLGALQTTAGVALTAGGLDVFTQSSPLSGNDLVHVNQLGQTIYANEYARVLLAPRRSTAAVGAGADPSTVIGPASATDGAVAVYDGTTGKLLEDGPYTPAQLLARANHTGTQSMSTLTGGAFGSSVFITAPSGALLGFNDFFGLRLINAYVSVADAQPFFAVVHDTGTSTTSMVAGPGGATAPTAAYLFDAFKQAATPTYAGTAVSSLLDQSATPVTVNGTITKTDLLSVSIDGAALGDVYELWAHGTQVNSSGVTYATTIGCELGASTIATAGTSNATSANAKRWQLVYRFTVGDASLAVQEGFIAHDITAAAAGSTTMVTTTRTSLNRSTTEDLSTAKTLKVTATHANADAGITTVLRGYSLHRIR